MKSLIAAVACLLMLAGAAAPKPTPTSPSGRTLLEAYVSAWNRHDFAALDKLLTPDAVHEDIAWPSRDEGPAQIKKFMQQMIEAEPDFDWRITTIVDGGSTVAAEWTWTATFTGDTPIGHVVGYHTSGRGASVVVIENGRIKRFTDYYDFASFFPKSASSATSSVATEPKNAPPPPDAKQQVLDLEDEWVTAEIKHDTATLRRILDDKFVASFGAAKPYDKEGFIKGIVSGDVDPTETQTLTDRTVIIDEDTAISVGTDTLHGTKKGAAYTEVARYTVTYIRRHDQWIALAEHLVEAPQAK